MKKAMRVLAKTTFLICATLGLGSQANAEVLNSGQAVNEKKVWTIKFNNKVKLDNVTKNYIKVVDSRGIFQNINLELEKDKKSIKVTPCDNGYKPGEKYTLKVMKGVKGESNKGLKKEISMDFYIKDNMSSDKLNTSINNVQNASFVVQDSEWIYYSDLTESNSIYRMKKDGSSKKVLYKGNSRICKLYLSNEYIYFVSHSGNFTQGEEYCIYRVKKDGVGKPQVICKNISVNYQFQIDGDSLYYVQDSRLMRSDLLGNNAKEILKNIENTTDEVFFLLKDKWIYYFGFDYRSGKATGIYKIKTDGSQKQCIVKNVDAQSMKVSSINIDGNDIYYKNFSGDIFKSDLKGRDLERVRFLNGVSGVNVFNGYIHYLYEGAVHKIKADGTEHSILAQKSLNDFDYINIVNGELWYLDTNKELKSVPVVTKDSGEDDGDSNPGNPVSLKEGDSFYIKGVNSLSSKVIKIETADVNGDGKKENVILAGVNENYSYKDLKIFIQKTSNGEILGYDSLKNFSCEEIGNSISLGDFNKDKISDIKIDLLLNTQRGMHATYIYTFTKDKLNKIFHENMIPAKAQDFKYKLLDDKSIKVYDDKGNSYIVNLASDDEEHYKYLTNIGIGPSITVFYEGEDIDRDGSLELSRTIYLVGVSYSDFLCSAKTTYKYNPSTSKWEYKGLHVESEFFPCTKVSSNSDNDDENNNEQDKQKSSIQNFVEKNNTIYYVQDKWTKRSKNDYYLSDSYLRGIKNDLSTSSTIANDISGKIQTYGKYMYYVSAYGVNLHRVKLDGSNDTVISKDIVKNFCISDGYIYYCSDKGGIYKMKQDGRDVSMLEKDKAEELVVLDDWLYYINNGSLYKMKTDGTSREDLGVTANKMLGASEDGVYYCISQKDGSSNLYRANIDGKRSKCIFEGLLKGYAVYDGYVYCINNTNNYIYKMKYDGSDLVKVSDEKAKDVVGVSEKFIYYKAGDTLNNEHLYRIKKTGGKPEKVD